MNQLLSASGPSARSAVAPFYVMRVFQAAEARRASGLPVYNLAVGQPGTPAPALAREAARQAAAGHRLGYTGALGLPELREAIACHVHDWYGIEVPAANVVVTTGSSGGFLAAFLGRTALGLLGGATAPGEAVPMAVPEGKVGSLVDLLGSTIVASQEEQTKDDDSAEAA